MMAIVVGAFLGVVVLVAALATGTPAALVLLVPCLVLMGLGFAAEVYWARREARKARALGPRGQEG